MTHPLYTCLWFNNNSKEAADYYCSIFKDSKILSENAMVVMFEVNGFRFMALNGGDRFKFNESISFVINCDTQDEIDYYWNNFINEGEEGMCGWCKDKYGVSWQVVPKILGELMNDKNKGPRVMQAFLKMRKFDIEGLIKA